MVAISKNQIYLFPMGGGTVKCVRGDAAAAAKAASYTRQNEACDGFILESTNLKKKVRRQ
jgi:hypothetical protein